MMIDICRSQCTARFKLLYHIVKDTCFYVEVGIAVGIYSWNL